MAPCGYQANGSTGIGGGPEEIKALIGPPEITPSIEDVLSWSSGIFIGGLVMPLTKSCLLTFALLVLAWPAFSGDDSDDMEEFPF